MSRFLLPILVVLLALVGSGCDAIPVEAPEALRAKVTTTHLVLTNQTDALVRYLASDALILALIDPVHVPILPPRQMITIPLDEVLGYRAETKVIGISWWVDGLDVSGSLQLPIR